MSRNPISQLATFGEEVLGKAAQNPTAARMLGSAMQLKDRVDDLSRRVRGLEGMEQRLEAVERRLDELEKPKRKPAAKKTEAKEAKAAGKADAAAADSSEGEG